MAIVFGDIESVSDRDIKAVGNTNYLAGPNTEILCLCYAVNDDPVQTWRPGGSPPAVYVAPAEHTFVWWNWSFDTNAHARLLVERYGFPPIPIEQHECAQRRAMASAYPAELGLCCTALGLPYAKDKAAIDALRRLARGKYKRPEDRERDIMLVIGRCVTDVEMLRAIHNHPRVRPLPADERAVLLHDWTINARGVCANVSFLEAVQAFAVAEREHINNELTALTDGAITSANQRDRILAAVNVHGHKMATLGKRSVAAVLARKSLDGFTRELLTLRKRGAFASPQKAKKLLAYADPIDHRIRNWARFYGAGTGRWTSVGAQLHNLGRNDLELPVTLIDAVLAGDRAELARFGDPLRVVSQLARASLCAAPGYEFICTDLAGIESRVVAWLAGEVWKLDLFRRYDATGDKLLDPYRVLARVILKDTVAVASITAAQRQLGKYSELAFGFGGAIGAWRGIAGDDGRSDAEIIEIVRVWRGRHPMIRAFWRRMMHATLKAIRTKQAVPVNPPSLPPITAAFDGYALTLTLPSGRVINYPGARIVMDPERGSFNIEFMDNSNTAPKKKVKGKKAEGTSGWRPARAWFGIFVENVVSGIARDLLAAAIVRAETRGWPVVHHSHDEIVLEVPIGTVAAADALALLLEAPAWAAGLPLGGKVRNGPLFFAGPATAEPPAQPAEMALPDEDEDAENGELDHSDRDDVLELDHFDRDALELDHPVLNEPSAAPAVKAECDLARETEHAAEPAVARGNGHGETTAGGPMGAYAQHAGALVERGYAAIPIMAGTKIPGFRCASIWVRLPKWQEQFLDRTPGAQVREIWGQGETGIGVVGGRASHGLIPVDIDTDDPVIMGALLAALPETPVRKVGQKGETRFYYGPDIPASRSWDIAGRRVCDLIADGRQTVLPPSIHEATGQPYRWLGPPLEMFKPDELPRLPADICDRIGTVLEPLGWSPPARASNGKLIVEDDDASPHRQLNNFAMTHLERWVPALQLYKWQRARGGYEAVATWRESSTGRPLEVRKLNLKIHPAGIKDFGDGRGGTYTPLDLVMAADGCDLDTAFKFLSDHTGWANAPAWGDGSAKGETPAPAESAEKIEAAESAEKVEAVESAGTPAEPMAKTPAEPAGTPTEPAAKAPSKSAAEASAELVAKAARKPEARVVLRGWWHGDANTELRRNYLVRKLIPETGTGLMSGQWGTYKTFAALDLAAAVMTGTVFAGHPVKRQGGVLFIAVEGREEIPIRLEALNQMKCGQAERLPFFCLDDIPPLLAKNAAEQIAAKANAVAAEMRQRFDLPLALIVVDTIVASAGYARAGDENDSALGARIMATLGQVSRLTAAFVLAVDHFGKAVETGTRGTSAKEGFADVVLALLGSKEITGAVKNPRMAARKRRAGPNGEEFAFGIQLVNLGFDEDGDPIDTLVIDWGIGITPDASTKSGSWPRSLRLLHCILMDLLVDRGVEIEVNGHKVRALDRELVREEFHHRYAADGDNEDKRQEARSRAFRRAIHDAQNRGLADVRVIENVTFIWQVALSD